MKKICLFFIFMFLILAPKTFANDDWNDFSGIDSAWDGQEAITNKQFEDTINALEEKKNQKETKKRKKILKKIGGGGTSLDPTLNPEKTIIDFAIFNKNAEGHLLNVPVSLIIDDEPLEKGFYKIIAKKDDNNDVYFYFYQSQFFKGKVRASVTNDDYEESELDFVRLQPYNDNFVKIIFGSLEYNAYAYVRFIQ